jgi:general secretion pathway protein M
MIASINAWWQSLSTRERWLVSIAALLAGGLAVWFLVITPLRSALDDAAAAHAAALDRQVAVNSRVAALVRHSNPADRAATPTAPASVIADQTAAEVSLPLARNDPAGDSGTAIAVSNARSTAALTLLHRLEAAGLSASEVTLRRNGDGTVALTATLRRAAP